MKATYEQFLYGHRISILRYIWHSCVCVIHFLKAFLKSSLIEKILRSNHIFISAPTSAKNLFSPSWFPLPLFPWMRRFNDDLTEESGCLKNRPENRPERSPIWNSDPLPQGESAGKKNSYSMLGSSRRRISRMQSGVGKAEIPTPHIRLSPQGGSSLIYSQTYSKNLNSVPGWETFIRQLS